jgi:hypothetical protein
MWDTVAMALLNELFDSLTNGERSFRSLGDGMIRLLGNTDSIFGRRRAALG